MRVLHVHSGNLYGGVETLLLTLARYRDLCPSMEPHFALCFEDQLSRNLEEGGASIHFLGNVRVRRPDSVWRARGRLRALLQKQRFDVVICHSCWSQAIFGPVVRSCGAVLVSWIHDAATGRHWLERWARRIPPDLAICNSRFTAESLRNLYPEIQHETVHCPIPLPEYKDSPSERAVIRAELNTSEDAIVIIQVSRLEACKGHFLHLETLSKLRHLSGWICWMAGGPQRPHEIRYLEELKNAAIRLGIAGRVRFLGQRSDISRLLSAADIYCQPNTGPESFGLSFIEALGAGLPVVTTALGGAKEIVDNSCGILVAPNDPYVLAASLQRLIQDSSRRISLGANGPTRARELCDPLKQMRQLCRNLVDASDGILLKAPCQNLHPA